MAYPLHRPDDAVPASPGPARPREATCSRTGRPTARSRRPIDAARRRRERRERVRLLRRPAVRQRPAALRPPAHRVRQGRRRRATRRMRGRRVERRFGWDTHGLPAELEAERLLGITDKSQIEEMGIAAFNEACRESVLRYTDEWQRVRHPPGALGRLRERLQDARRHATWSRSSGRSSSSTTRAWPTRATACCRTAGATRRRCPTTSCAWTTTSTQSRQDPALTVGAAPGDRRARRCIWTTTPWTLPTNLALAVGPDIEYVVVRARRRARPLAGERVRARPAARLGAYATRARARTPTVVRDRHGRRPRRAAATRRRSPTSPGRANAHQVLAGDFVTTEDGTGIVHLAPAFGEDDMVACDAAGITPVVPGRPQGPVHRRGARLRRPAGLRREHADHRRPQGRHRPARARRRRPARRASCGTRPTSTPTRTAGAAGTR